MGTEEQFSRAVSLHQSGDLDAAESLYRDILEATPAHAGALSNLGVILSRRNELDEAARCFNSALSVNPNQLDAHFNLGNLYRKQGKLQDAINAYQTALNIQPGHPRVLLNLGLAVSDLGDLPSAIDLFRRAVQRDPGFGDAYNLLGDSLFRMGQTNEAVDVFREYVVLSPEDARGHHNLGLALAARGDAEAALPELEQALKLKPDYAEAHNSLAVALDAVNRADEAITHYRKATELKPNFADAWSNLGTALTEQARTKDAMAALRTSLDLRPDSRVHSNLLLAMVYSSQFKPEELRDEHKAWASAHATGFAEPPAIIDPDPNRRLRIGYVCGDFRQPTAIAFLELLLTHHDRNRVHVTCYPAIARSNEVAERLRRRSDSWRPIHSSGDPNAVKLMREDSIDVLVDLAGHMAGNRLTAFALRPARVQVHLFGYPVTTGLPAIDYRISDAFADPPGESDNLYTESVFRLPEVAWAYRTPEVSPDVPPLPSLKKKGFTFGSLSNPSKYSDAAIEAWAKVLKAVPKSRLVLMTGRSAEAAGMFVKRFGKLGIASDRIEPVSRLPENQYLEAYQPIDLALDPFPFNGGVTTCDSLWMGVPVLTVAGRDQRSRRGVSILNNVGLPEFIADTPGKLVELAASWADQREGLADIRGSLREMVKQSPLADVKNYVRNLEAAYRQMWAEKQS